MSRREALSTVAKVGIAAGASAVVAGSAGYYASQMFTPSQSNQGKPVLELVTWGSPYIEATQPLANAFTQQTGIPVRFELHVGGSATVIDRIKADLPVINRDSINAWNPVWAAMDEEGWLAPLTPDKISGYNDFPQSAYFTGPKSGEVVAIGHTTNEGGYVYREDLFPKDLQPFDDFNKLLDPRLKGKVAIHPMTVSSGDIVWLPALQFGGNEKNPDPGWNFLTKLAQSGNVGTVYNSEAEVVQLLTSGDAWITDVGGFSDAIAVKAQNIPIKRDKNKVVRSFANLEGWCIMKDSPRVDEAYDWLNYWLTGPVISQYAAGVGEPPLCTKATVPSGLDVFYSTSAEIDSIGYIPDYVYISTVTDAWETKFETDILPLIKTS